MAQPTAHKTEHEEIRATPGLEPADAPHPLQRRRTLDEMQHALRLLASGNARPRDDDSPQILEDVINECITLRQLVADLMQASLTMHQNGLTAIRRMTEHV